MPSNLPNSDFVPFEEFIDRAHKRVSSAGVLIENMDSEVLAIKATYKSYWGCPGGIIDASESPAQAAVRELREETGLKVELADIDFVAVHYRKSDLAETYAFIFRLREPISGHTTIRIQESEIEAYKWVSATEVNEAEFGSYNAAIMNWAQAAPVAYSEHVLK